ncbi:uncharacterized protein ATNIH1004_001009 [Aspergillus tanneri]|uniref:Uncharacterized protein n=1 Tax=Aspergillus tanneri TaxID=1220188 RepID=A0A5M9MYD1_9EURO|nr:uncharacterized protein ATNIH1004_001009 [Aspergillus tanneri]KAA8652105.1 hypothetical protein ATNIH1004_001009 [Aspergillus tanneri]
MCIEVDFKFHIDMGGERWICPNASYRRWQQVLFAQVLDQDYSTGVARRRSKPTISHKRGWAIPLHGEEPAEERILDHRNFPGIALIKPPIYDSKCARGLLVSPSRMRVFFAIISSTMMRKGVLNALFAAQTQVFIVVLMSSTVLVRKASSRIENMYIGVNSN